jgi:hypothetical protein
MASDAARPLRTPSVLCAENFTIRDCSNATVAPSGASTHTTDAIGLSLGSVERGHVAQ